MNDRLSDLFNSVTWLPVEDAIRVIDPEDTEGVPDLYVHRRVFEQMCRIEPASREDWLVVEVYLDEPDEQGVQDSWVNVSCTDLQYEEHRDGESRFGIDFLPWAECLGMRVTEESRSSYSDAEIVAHCLQEMTFYGFDEEKIQEDAREITKAHEDGPSKDAIPIEEMFQRLGLGENAGDDDDAGSSSSSGSEESAPRPAAEGAYRVTVHPRAVLDLAMLKWRCESFVDDFVIPESNLRNWEINRRNLVLSATICDGPRLERISWHPLTGEMIFSGRGESYHNMDIHNHGSHPFHEYVRALVLPEKRIVATRPWCPIPDEFAQLLDGHLASRLSEDGQNALKTVLVSAGLPKSWRFVLDIDNAKLEQLTGRRGW